MRPKLTIPFAWLRNHINIMFYAVNVHASCLFRGYFYKPYLQR